MLWRAAKVAAFLTFSCAISDVPAFASGFGACDVESTAPEAVKVALDNVLVRAVDPPPELAKIFGSAPGAVLSVVTPDWLYVRSFGVSDPVTGSPMDCGMPFQIGSNTKMMTAVVLLQLVEEGALDLSAHLSKYLPEIAATLPYGDEITLRQLARHTSGVFSYTDNAPDGTPGLMEGDIADPVALRRGYTPEELIGFAVAHGQPDFAPDAEGRWTYTNTGYVLLGLVIEKIEGRPIGASYDARIFAPLGMTKTFIWNDIPTPAMGLPRAFYEAPFKIETSDWNMSQGWAAGAVVSTVDDMQRFIQALFESKLFRSDETLVLMKDAAPTTLATMTRYGIGLGEKEPGVWGHGGQTLGFESDVAFFEDRGISIVGWATSAKNAMGLGAPLVAQALRDAAVLPDPLIEESETLRAKLSGTHWQLHAIERPDGKVEGIAAPERYDVAFTDSNRVVILADCNRALGDWRLERLALTIELGPSTLAACPPNSMADVYLAALASAVSAEMTDSGLLIHSTTEDETTVLKFEAAR